MRRGSADGGVTFRRLSDDDLPTLYRWLNEPGVVRWWEGDDVSWDGVQRDYGAATDGAVEHWVAMVDGRAVGWIQCYPVGDSPEEAAAWFALGVDRDAAGIDYLIGDPADRGRGLGARMIRAFVRDIVFGLHPSWAQACADPYEANAASWRALATAGFSRVGHIDDSTGRCVLMVIDREAGVAIPGREVG